MGYRRTLLGDLWKQGRREEVHRLIEEAIVNSRGNMNEAAWLVDFQHKKHLYRYLDRSPHLWAVLHGVRRARRGAPMWLVRTLAAIEAGRMSALESLLQLAAGMNVDEVEAEVAASVHAGECDPHEVAEAIVASAASVAGG